MNSIKDTVSNTLVIKKSKFITYLYRIDNKKEANNILNTLKQEYKDATHICFGYIIEGNEKCSDDKEPNGTAGIPILSVLKHNNLDHILCVVIRYFGGIKLGAGGLARAYLSSAVEIIKKANIITLTKGYLIEIEFNYNQTKLIDQMLYNKKIVTKKYDNNIFYLFYLEDNELDLIKSLEKIVINLSIKDKIKMEKKDII